MNKYLITAVAMLCGITLASCSDSSNDDTAKLMLAMQGNKSSSGSGNTTGYTDMTHTFLQTQYTDIYSLKTGTTFSTDIENILGKTCLKADSSLDYDEIVVHDANNTDSYYKATYYLFNQITAELTETTGNIIGKGVYVRDSANKVKTLNEYTFDSPLTKADADAYTGKATMAYYESFEDTGLTKSNCRCVYMPSKDNEIDTWTTIEYYAASGTGDLKVEKTVDYLPFNLKWDENAKKGVAIDSSLVTDNKVTFKNYKGEAQPSVGFPVVNEKVVTYKKSTSGNAYDFEAVMNNDFQRIHTVTTNSTDRYQMGEASYYCYDFTWDTGVCAESYIQQVCWKLEKSGDAAIDIENTGTFVKGDRSSTVIKDTKKFGSKKLITRITWLNTELKTNYYRVFDYEGVTKSDGTMSDTEFYEYMYKQVISDATSDYPTHVAFSREGHQDYVNGKNVYAVIGYSNESSYKNGTMYTGTSSGTAENEISYIENSRSLSEGSVRTSFANPLPGLRHGHAERL